jgi:hypothetical protein
MRDLGRLSRAAKLNVAGLVMAAAGMALQILGGSLLYPTFAGPIVLLVAAIVVAFSPGRWKGWIALGVPLVLGLGAIVAALMSNTFMAQLTDVSRPLVLVGSLMHVLGLLIAIFGGAEMIMRPEGQPK